MTRPPAPAADPRTRRRWVVLALSAAAAVGGGLSGAQPSGTAAVDVVLTAAFAATFTLACARARRWSWIVCSTVAVVFARSALVVPALAAEVLAVSAVRMDHRSRRVGALVGAVTVQVLLRLPPLGFHGATALVAGAAAAPVLVSGYRNLARSRRRLVTRVGLGLAGATAVLAAAFLASVLLARSEVEEAVVRSRHAFDAARHGDPAAAEAELDAAGVAFDEADEILSSWWARPARALPVVGQQATALAEVTDAGDALTATAATTVRSADSDRLRYRSGRLDLALMASMHAPLRRAVDALETTEGRVSRARSPWLLSPVQRRMEQLSAELADALPEARLAAEAVEVGPGLLGADGPRRYFVAFVTPAELRGAGGLIGNFAELTAVDGRVRLTRSGRIRELNQAVRPGSRRLRGPADYLDRYGRFRPADHFQDATFSPDFPSTARVIEQLYPQSGGKRIDGVISVDPFALARLLRFTGPIEVDGLAEPLTSENAADVLLREQYERFDQATAERIDVLEQASRRTFDALTTGSLPEPSEVADQLGPAVRQGRLLMHSVHPAEQRLLERTGLAGDLPRPDDGDFLSVITQNAGNNKIDVFLHRSVDYRARLDPATGELTAEVRVRLRNDAPATGLPRYVIGNLRGRPPGTNYQSISIYTPHRLEAATVDGRPRPFESQTELGHRVHGTFVAVPPGRTVTLALRLRGDLGPGADYALTAASQPTVNTDRLTVSVRGPAGQTEPRTRSLKWARDRRWEWSIER